MNRIDRGAFLKLGITVAAATATACGGEDDEPAGGGPASGAGTGWCSTDLRLTHTSSASHDHLPLTRPITAAELNAGGAFEYALPNESAHIHTIAFTAQDLANLRAGMTITKTSTVDSGHSHTYTMRCV